MRSSALPSSTGNFRFPTPSLKWFFRRALGYATKTLLLSLFVYGMDLAPFAVLPEFYFARDELAVLARPIVGATALAAREFEKLIL